MTLTSSDRAALQARADWLARRLNLIPALYGPGAEGAAERKQRADRHHYEVALLVSALEGLDPPGRVTRRGVDAALSMMGITSTAAAGFLAACQNWIARARSM